MRNAMCCSTLDWHSIGQYAAQRPIVLTTAELTDQIRISVVVHVFHVAGKEAATCFPNIQALKRQRKRVNLCDIESVTSKNCNWNHTVALLFASRIYVERYLNRLVRISLRTANDAAGVARAPRAALFQIRFLVAIGVGIGMDDEGATVCIQDTQTPG